MQKIGRRGFLKIAAAVPAGMVLSRLISQLGASQPSSPNIIVIVLDALTARNMSLYGYPRKTTPNIGRFAARSDVYHAHHAAGTFTTSGVASLLTGTYPWTHRAINLEGLIARDRYERNIFKLLSAHYNTVGFTQNYYADYLLSQFSRDVEQHLPIESFSGLELYLGNVKQKDYPFIFRSYDGFLFSMEEGSSPGSLVLGTLNAYRKENIFQNSGVNYPQSYRRELLFDIDKVFAGLASRLADSESPSFYYFHLLPPHEPYAPRKSDTNLFRDGWQPPVKPKHPLKTGFSNDEQDKLDRKRLRYDQFIVTTDAAFGSFLDVIESAGLLDNSYLILTSDHGESFERGYLAHAGPFVYEPSIHVPLLVSSPGQNVRRDFYSATNNVDLVPTFLKLSGLEIPDWGEGEILPGFGGKTDDTRATFSMDAKAASSFGDLSPITITMRRGDYKLIYYKGYGKGKGPYHQGVFELYNLRDDPEEMNDLVNDEMVISQQMKGLLLEAYNAANRPLD